MGESVQEFFFKRGSSELASPGKTSVELRGEGVVIDLAEHGLFVSTFVELARPDGTGAVPSDPVWGDHRPVDRNWRAANRLAGALLSSEVQWEGLASMERSPSVSLSPVELPLLLRFMDPADPLSVRRVSVVPRDPDVEVVAASVEITTEPVTRGRVAAVLPWAPDYASRYLNLAGERGTLSNAPLEHQVQASDFLRDWS